MKVLSNGAEAVIFKTNYLKKTAVKKKRIAKKYRNPNLDAKIRTQRTKQECLLLHKAKKAIVRCPVIFKVDKKNYEITMELVKGKKAKDVLNKKNFVVICKKIGRGIGKLHSKNIIHGDLTTSNIILTGKNIAFVDFGMGFFSKKTEDFSCDLLSLKKTWLATHFNLLGGFEQILLGYKKTFFGGKQVIEKISEIEARTRYSAVLHNYWLNR